MAEECGALGEAAEARGWDAEFDDVEDSFGGELGYGGRHRGLVELREGGSVPLLELPLGSYLGGGAAQIGRTLLTRSWSWWEHCAKRRSQPAARGQQRGLQGSSPSATDADWTRRTHPGREKSLEANPAA